MNNRIELIIEKMNLSSSQFADEIGVARAIISHLITGRNKPSLDVVRKILLRFPQINPDWLLTGKGDFYRSPIENVIIDETIVKAPEERKKNQPTLFPEEVHRAMNTLGKSTHESLGPKTGLEQLDHTHKSFPGSTASAEEQKNIRLNTKNEVQTIIMIYSDNTFELLKPSNKIRE